VQRPTLMQPAVKSSLTALKNSPYDAWPSCASEASPAAFVAGRTFHGSSYLSFKRRLTPDSKRF